VPDQVNNEAEIMGKCKWALHFVDFMVIAANMNQFSVVQQGGGIYQRKLTCVLSKEMLSCYGHYYPGYRVRKMDYIT
jgi:hypothetical protein